MNSNKGLQKRLHLICTVITCATLALPVYGQFHLITGSPAPKYPETFGAALLRVNDDGSVKTIADLVPPEIGTEWIAVSYEWRKVLIQQYDHNPIIVVDFDKAAVVKTCDRPKSVGLSLIRQWLTDIPVTGPVFAWFLANDKPADYRAEGLILDASVSCEHSYLTLQPADIKYIVANGTSGVTDVGSFEGTYVATDEKGTVITNVAGSLVSFDYQVPAALMQGFDQPYDNIIINNPNVFVLSLVEKTRPARLLAFRKSDKTWHQIPARGTVRGFGRFIAIAEASAKVEPAVEPAGPAVPRSAKSDTVRESAGKAAWRTTASRMGPSILGRFNGSRSVYPGRLHLYDVETERIDTIVTNQADSEVLLIEDGIVYYRSSDRLYSAKITKSGIGVPHLMAAAEEIRDAHWAFIKHRASRSALAKAKEKL